MVVAQFILLSWCFSKKPSRKNLIKKTNQKDLAPIFVQGDLVHYVGLPSP